jgi:GT2 family glycosyltransferase
MRVVFQSIRQWFPRGRKAEKRISIICAYNNLKKLNDYLIQSLNKQNAPFELLTIDNAGGDFTSAARILNEAAKKAKYEYLMFVHQDVALDSNTWLANVQTDLGSLYRLGAAGVAGKGKDGLAASVRHGNPPYFAGPERLRRPARVQTLDGCLMIVPREIFKRISFDETTCDGWYLYVGDYCLDLTRLGYRIYVLPHQIYHESTGPCDRSVYEKARKNIIEKHRYHTKMIYTTIGDWEI